MIDVSTAKWHDLPIERGNPLASQLVDGRGNILAYVNADGGGVSYSAFVTVSSSNDAKRRDFGYATERQAKSAAMRMLKKLEPVREQFYGAPVGGYGEPHPYRGREATIPRRDDLPRESREAHRAAHAARLNQFHAMPGYLYIGDNGMTLCGAHLGMSARTTGRDRSGQKIHEVTLADARYARSVGTPIRCETCGKPAREKGETERDSEGNF